MSSDFSQLQDFAKEHTPRVLREMRDFFTQQKEDARQNRSPHFLESLEILEEFVFRGGKNIRSLLVVLAYQLGGGKSTEIYKVAGGIELFHKHLLALDDTVDRDESRYGGPTLWKKYQDIFKQKQWSDAHHHGRSLSEIATTLLGSFSFEMVTTAKFSAADIVQVIDIMHQTMYWQTVEGWEIQYFQNHEPLSQASEEEFLRGLELVTAQYSFAAPLHIGLLLAGADSLVKTIEEYALHVGRAFQITDDILGLFGDSMMTGKPVGNDVREGKKTLLLQCAYHAADAKDKKFLEKICGSECSQKDLARVQDLVRQTGSLAYSEQLAKDSVQHALNVLQKLPKQTVQTKVLEDLACFVVSRQA